MFAARVLKPLFHGRSHISSLGRNCKIAAISKRVLQDRFSQILNISRLSGNGVGISRAFHSSPQCYTDVGVKTHAPALFSHLEDDFYSELGSVEKDVNRNVIVQMLLTEKKPEPFQVEKSQKTKGKKKKTKKKKKHEQASDSISKPILLTEKPQVSWNTNGKRKTELAHTSSPARDVTDSNVSFSKPTMSSSQIQDHNSKSQKIITPSSEAKNETSSKGSSTSDTPSNRPSSVVVIRIGKLNLKTADSVIHSMCSSIGPFEGLARVNEGTVDVMFRVTKLNEADSILKELNDATVDNSQWTAEIVPESEEASKDQMGMRITSCCEDMEKQLVMQRVLGKDLEILLHSVMHLENHPMAREMD